MKYLTQRVAQAIDVELMSPTGSAFGFEQLVELAGFSVAQAITKEYSPETFGRIFVCSGPGNNGLDGLVAARHLSMFGYQPRIYYPKRSDKAVNKGLFKQCVDMKIPIIENPSDGLADADLVLDAIFGFSFSGQIRAPFATLIDLLQETKVPIVSIDIPSGWDVEKGNINVQEQETTSTGLQPDMLVSLTAPKLGSKDFRGRFHYLGGRFISKEFAKTWDLTDLPPFPGTDQCVRLPTNHQQQQLKSTDPSPAEVIEAAKKKKLSEKMDDLFVANTISNVFM